MGDSGWRGARDYDRLYDRDYERDDAHRHRKRSRSRSRSPARSSRPHQDRGARRHRSPSSPPAPRRRKRIERRQARNERRREVLVATKAVPIEQFRKDYKTGKYAHLSHDEKLAMFGTATMPIFVPLAPGESEDEYDARFRAWLRRLDRSFERLRADSDPYKERQMRIDFAIDNVLGFERFEDFDWAAHTAENSAATEKSAKRVEGLETKKTTPTSTDHQDNATKVPDGKPKKGELEGESSQRVESAKSDRKKPGRVCPCKQPSAKSGLTPAVLAEAHLSCGCTPCLFAVMDRLAQKVQAIECIQAGAHGATRSVVDLTDE